MAPIGGEIPQLTGLRAVAALMVLSLHLDQIHGNTLAQHISPVAQGFLGVDIFFVLSGYILSHVYAHSVTTSVATYGVFLWRRLMRIYPLHLATLAALFVMVAARGLLNTNFWDVSDLPRHIFLLQAWTPELTWNLPSWSISAEWAAYVAFPIAVMLILRPSRLFMPLLIVLGLLLAFQIVGIARTGIAGSWLGWSAASRIAAEFSLGVLGFRLSLLLRPSFWSDIAAAGAFCLLFLLPANILQILAIGVLVPAIATSTGFVRRLLASRARVALGVISYAIYMVHFPAIKLIQNVNDKLGIEQLSAGMRISALLFWAGVILTLAAAAYYVIERPARNWGRSQEKTLFSNATGLRREA